jgi:hypothetical protein
MGERYVVQQSDILVWVVSLSGTVVMFVDQDMPSMLEMSVTVMLPGTYIPALTSISPVTWWDQWTRAEDQYDVPTPAETRLRM